MKKIILFLLSYFLLWCINVFADSWTSGPINRNATSNLQNCPTSTSHSITHDWIPNSTWLVWPSSSIWCTTHTYYTSSDHTIPVTWNNWITSCPAWERFVSIAPSPCTAWSCTMTCRKYDDIAPTVSATNSAASRKVADISITLLTADTWWSNLVQSIYNWGTAPNAWCTGWWTNFSSWDIITNSINWIRTLYLCSRDNAWNITTWSWSYWLDKADPVVTPPWYTISWWTTLNNTRTNTGVTVTRVCSDKVSWCATSQYHLSSTPFASCDWSLVWWVSANSYNFNVTAWNFLENYICFRSYDNAWNWPTYGEVATVKIDKINPTDLYSFPFTPWDWVYLSTHTITLTWSDANSWLDRFEWCEWSTCNPSSWSSWTTIIKNSIYNNTIKYRIWDEAWNHTDWQFLLKLNWPILQEKFKDNDSNARSEIVWYVTETWSLENIFWNNAISNEYINKNINNSDWAYEKIWDVTSWNIKITVDKSSTVRVVKFDRSKYTANKELYVVDSFEGNVVAWSWYITKNPATKVLSLSWTIWSNAYYFDFKNNDYAIFVKNNWVWVLNYKISWLSWTKWIYINPINDSFPKEIRILSSHIILSNWLYIWKQAEYIKLK